VFADEPGLVSREMLLTLVPYPLRRSVGCAHADSGKASFQPALRPVSPAHILPLGIGQNFPDLFRRAADYVDKILRGAKPGNIPVEQPTKFDLVVNLITAKALGLSVPPSLLLRADEVIE